MSVFQDESDSDDQSVTNQLVPATKSVNQSSRAVNKSPILVDQSPKSVDQSINLDNQSNPVSKQSVNLVKPPMMFTETKEGRKAAIIVEGKMESKTDEFVV